MRILFMSLTEVRGTAFRHGGCKEALVGVAEPRPDSEISGCSHPGVYRIGSLKEHMLLLDPIFYLLQDGCMLLWLQIAQSGSCLYTLGTQKKYYSHTWSPRAKGWVLTLGVQDFRPCWSSLQQVKEDSLRKALHLHLVRWEDGTD